MNTNKFFNEIDNNEEIKEENESSWAINQETEKDENDFSVDKVASTPVENKEDNPICGVSLDKSTQYDSYWDRNSLPLKIVLYGLLIFIVAGCLYYAIMWFMK